MSRPHARLERVRDSLLVILLQLIIPRISFLHQRLQANQINTLLSRVQDGFVNVRRPVALFLARSRDRQLPSCADAILVKHATMGAYKRTQQKTMRSRMRSLINPRNKFRMKMPRKTSRVPLMKRRIWIWITALWPL